MCGIVGYVGRRAALAILMEGLRHLEYRGYDSAGVVLHDGSDLVCRKAPGRIDALEKAINGEGLPGRVGLGHTRWATHGGVNVANAHPHFSCDSRIAVVHNGIIENYSELRAELAGHAFHSTTDTEVVPHLIEQYYRQDPSDFVGAVLRALERVRGSFALGVLCADHPNMLVGARLNCPLVLGVGAGENFLASDVTALLPYTRRILPLEENELAVVDEGRVQVFDRSRNGRDRAPMHVPWTPEAALKGGYPHFMLKEIHEQATTLPAEMDGRAASLDELNLPADIGRVTITACGTALHAGLVAKVALEQCARIPVDVVMASELRYGEHPFGRDTLTVAISQSGETADTLAAARAAAAAGSTVLAITNARGSTLALEAERVLFMRCGLEIGVAATKTYTSQVMNVLLLALHLGLKRGVLTRERFDALFAEGRAAASSVARVLDDAGRVEACAREYARGHDFLFIGRRYNYATACEGALKMKEISYLHAEGYAAGEMKHGPLALVDDHMVCVAVAPRDRVTEKTVSNIQEVRARQGKVISVGTAGDSLVRSVSDHMLEIPQCAEMFSPLLAAVPLQLLAYYCATELERDVDRPRNLAKSVTVE